MEIAIQSGPILWRFLLNIEDSGISVEYQAKANMCMLPTQSNQEAITRVTHHEHVKPNRLCAVTDKTTI